MKQDETYLETTPDADASYRAEKKDRVAAYREDRELIALSNEWRAKALERKYMYGFSWLGRPLIQFPADIVAIQEIIWSVKPDLIIETGVAHGGSLILSASILELIGHGQVIGIDIDIRPHNRKAIEEHPLSKRIHLIEGSSVAPEIISRVRSHVRDGLGVLVLLDSSHTHAHVLAELDAYATLVSVGSYCVVFDTFIDDMHSGFEWGKKPWSKNNNPKTAVNAWLSSHHEFEIDRSIEDRLLTTSAPGGFLRRIRR